jgi:hypothetical protein
MISGQAAADVVHLLAELIENATLFSPQSTQVRVTVMELSSGGVLVEVRDDGVGVSPNRLADMNWRLDHPPVVDVSISRHMGLYAVSRLAARHGIRVKLRPGAPQGLSALVWLPGTLAKREPTPAGGGQSRSYGMDTTGPVQGIRTASAPPRPVTGRHRGGLAVRAEQPLTAGQGGQGGQGAQPGRPAAWFAAKRPSSGAAVAEEELATGWQTSTGWQAAANWQAGANRNATADGGPLSEPAERTSSGLPRRVPRTSAYPGSDTPGSGMPSMPGSPMPATAPATAAANMGAADMGAADMGAPVLGAPPGGTGPQGQPYREAPYQEQVPSRRRSPEAARSRLAGFQLGSRDAVQAGHGTGWKPFAGEENSR